MNLEEIIYKKFAEYPSKITGGTVCKSDGLLLIDSGVDSDTFNIVCKAKNPNITAAINHFNRRPFCWWVGPSSEPENLGELLIEKGFTFEAVDIGLAVSLREISLEEKCSPHITIKQVSCEETLSDFVSTFTQLFPSDQKEAIKTFYDMVAILGFKTSDSIQNFVAYYQDTPASIASYFINGNTAAFFDFITLPQFRKKGIGTALTIKLMKDLKDQGVEHIALSASPDSQGIYRKLGFTQFGHFSTYTWP